MRSASGTPVYPVSGSSGAYGGDPPPPQGGPGGGGRWGGGGDDRGEFGYYEEERYWTDYLRIAMPILGVLLMVALFWFWVSTFLGDDNGNGETANDDNGLPTTEATATDEDQAGADETQEDPVELPTATDAPGEPTDVPEESEEPEGENGEPEEPDDPGGGEIYPGATVEVGNTGGAGVNVRAEPSTEAEVLNIFADGIQVTTTDDAIEAEGFIWWPITGEGIELGWIVDDYLILIE